MAGSTALYHLKTVQVFEIRLGYEFLINYNDLSISNEAFLS